MSVWTGRRTRGRLVALLGHLGVEGVELASVEGPEPDLAQFRPDDPLADGSVLAERRGRAAQNLEVVEPQVEEIIDRLLKPAAAPLETLATMSASATSASPLPAPLRPAWVRRVLASWMGVPFSPAGRRTRASAIYPAGSRSSSPSLQTECRARS